MSFSTQNDLDRSAGAIEAEETLRLIASLPAPEGIEERLKSGIQAADRQARVMSWPVQKKANWTQVPGMRAAAAPAVKLPASVTLTDARQHPIKSTTSPYASFA